MAQTWMDSDGLYHKYGTDKAIATIGGEFKTYGQMRWIELTVDLTTLTSTSAIISDQVFFPKNARIEEVQVLTTTAAVGATATLDFGIIGTDRATVPTNGGTAFVKAATVASIAAVGTKLTMTAGSTAAGDFIGTTNATIGYLTGRANTATFSAGVVKFRIGYWGV